MPRRESRARPTATRPVSTVNWRCSSTRPGGDAPSHPVQRSVRRRERARPHRTGSNSEGCRHRERLRIAYGWIVRKLRSSPMWGSSRRFSRIPSGTRRVPTAPTNCRSRWPTGCASYHRFQMTTVSRFTGTRSTRASGRYRTRCPRRAHDGGRARPTPFMIPITARPVAGPRGGRSRGDHVGDTEASREREK